MKTTGFVLIRPTDGFLLQCSWCHNSEIQACVFVFIVKQWSRRTIEKMKLIKSWIAENKKRKRPGERTMLTTTLWRSFRIGVRRLQRNRKTIRRENACASCKFTASTQTEWPARQTSTWWQQRQSCKLARRLVQRQCCSQGWKVSGCQRQCNFWQRNSW